MGTTLLTPKVKIFTCHIDDKNIAIFEKLIEDMSDKVRGVCVSETMKITWLIAQAYLVCVIEWCE